MDPEKKPLPNHVGTSRHITQYRASGSGHGADSKWNVVRLGEAQTRCAAILSLTLLAISVAWTGAWAQPTALAVLGKPRAAASYAIRSDTKRVRADLEGLWVGDAGEIRFDQDAMQINFDRTRPFQWAPVWILDISGKLFVLAVGSERYVVQLDGDLLTMTRAGVDGARQFRKPPTGHPR